MRCITTNVNIGCCRRHDNDTNPVLYGGRVGEWLYPDYTTVPRPYEAFNFSRRGYFQEVRLTVESGKTAGPPGIYTCNVPDGVTGEDRRATILLVSSKSTSTINVRFHEIHTCV